MVAREGARPGAVRVRVPATSANLGSGFDSVGLALTLYDEVVVALADDGRVQVDVVGEGAAELPRDARHLVAHHVRAAMEAGDRALPVETGGPPAQGRQAQGRQAQGRQAQGLRMRCVNRLPQGRGLGSSAAAIVAGVLAGLALSGSDLRRDGLALQLAAAAEGHADNVAACLLGGATICWADPDPDADGEVGLDGRCGPSASYHAVRLPVHPDIVPVLFVPGQQVATSAARAMLPTMVPHRDATAQAARAALLVEALTRSPQLLWEATRDWLHQPYRAAAMPASAGLVSVLRSEGLAAMISGSGPAVLTLTTRQDVSTVTAAPAGWECMVLGVDRDGATVGPITSTVGAA